jgi:hypothetical protein
MVEALQCGDPLSKKSYKITVQYLVVRLTLKWVQTRGPNPANEKESQNTN